MLYLNTTKDAEDENQKKKIGLMAMGPEKGRERSSPSSSSSKPLHNFNLPFGLRWGNQKFLRCMKVSSNGEISAVQRRSSSISSVSAAVNASNGNHNHNLNASSSADFVSMIGKRKEREANFRRGSDFKRLSSNFKPPPPPLPPSWSTAAETGDGDGIASVREKLLFDLQTAADKMKDSILREGLETEEQDNNPTSSATANVAATVAPAASKTAEPAARPWFLRSRRAAFKASTENGFSSGGAETSNGGAGDSSPSRSLKVAENNKSSPRLRSGGATATASPSCEKKERAKFSVSLMRQEIEEDFLATAGRRPPRRPQKRSKYVQNKLDTLFPGLWLTEITADMYKVPETQ